MMSRFLLISLIVWVPFSFIHGVTLSSIKELKWTVMKQQISSIEFEGLSILTPKELEKMSQLKVQQILTISALNKDVERLMKTGYFRSVRYQLIEKGRWVTVRYIVEENDPIKEIQIKGVTIVTHDALKNILKSKINLPYNLKYINEDRNNLEAYYHNMGYDLMVVESITYQKDGVVVITVNEGQIEGVRFLGLGKIKPFILSRSLVQNTNQIYNSYRVQKDRRRLIQTGYFSTVSLPDLSQRSDRNNVTITYQLIERKFNYFNLGLEQLPDDQGIAGFFKVYYNHLWIHSDQLSLKTQLQYNQELKFRSFTLQYKQPWLLNRFNLEGRVSFFQEFYKVPLFGESNAIESKRSGARLSLNKSLEEDKVMLSTIYRHVRVEPTITLFTPYDIRSISLVSVYDNRQDNFDLNTGQYIDARFEKGLTILNSLDFQKWQLNGASFFEVTPRTTLAIKAGIGVYKKQGSVLTFDSEAFYLGGANTLRGYPELAFVGNKRILMNIEYRLRIANDVHTVLFYDIGNVFETSFNSRFDEYPSGYGIGFRYVTGIAPLRLDIAKSKEWMVHLGLGQLF